MRVSELRDRICGDLPDLSGRRVIVYTAFGAKWRAKVDVARARTRGTHVVVFTDEASAKGQPHSIPVDCDGLKHSRAASLYKIATPLLLNANSYINLDADTEVRGRADQIAVAFQMVENFQIVAAQHPVHTWCAEPLSDEIRALFNDLKITVLMPLWMGCAVGRYGEDRADRLTKAWFEFFQHDMREQPALVAAIHQTGIAPLTANEGWLSYSMDCDESLFYHKPQSAPIVSFFSKQIRWMAEQREIEKCLMGKARLRHQLYEAMRLLDHAYGDLEDDDAAHA
jgi:hypothetical protein